MGAATAMGEPVTTCRDGKLTQPSNNFSPVAHIEQGSGCATGNGPPGGIEAAAEQSAGTPVAGADGAQPLKEVIPGDRAGHSRALNVADPNEVDRGRTPAT